MDEDQFGRAIVALKNHSEALQLIIDQTKLVSSHPNMAGSVLALHYERSIEDMEHHALALVAAAHEMIAVVDRRRKREK